ncbi:12104_t:CDS:2, partial [Racocetra persica]
SRGVLENVTGSKLRTLVSPFTNGKKIHILKKLNKNFGHIHFETRDGAENFYEAYKDDGMKVNDNGQEMELCFRPSTVYNDGENIENARTDKRRYHDERIEGSTSGAALKRNNTEILIEFLKNDGEFKELTIIDDFCFASPG